MVRRATAMATLLLQASELFEAEFGVESKVEVNVTNSAGGARTA